MTQTLQRVTTPEFEAFIALEQNADRRFELIEGEITEKAMTTLIHGYIAGRLSQFLNNFFDAHPEIVGVVSVEARHRPTGDENNDRLPDVAVTPRRVKFKNRGVEDYIPDICIEIKSPDDPLKRPRAKAAFYLAHGAQVALVILPEKRLVEVYMANGSDTVLLPSEDLTFPDLLPGFSVSVDKLFPPADRIEDES